MIEFDVSNDEQHLLLIYTSEYNGIQWVTKKFSTGLSVHISKVFTFFKDDIFENSSLEYDIENEERLVFIIGNLQNNYYEIKRNVLNIEYQLFISKTIIDDNGSFVKKMFIAERNISVFRKIGQINKFKTVIYIGDDNTGEGYIPLAVFKQLIEKFPSSSELDKYVEYRIGNELEEFFEMPDTILKYQNLKVKSSRLSQTLNDKRNILIATKELELKKYEVLVGEIQRMLTSSEKYSEPRDWQPKILQVLQIIYPQYIHVFREAKIKDENGKRRKMDYMLVDTDGHIDIIELKLPDTPIISNYPRNVDTHTPLYALTGTIMQIEKYIFWLNKGGINAEKDLNKQYQEQLTKTDVKIKIINPTGIIVMGRDNNLSKAQKEALEIVKRQYKNIVDIITYDDLLKRLKQLINKFQNIEYLDNHISK